MPERFPAVVAAVERVSLDGTDVADCEDSSRFALLIPNVVANQSKRCFQALGTYLQALGAEPERETIKRKIKRLTSKIRTSEELMMLSHRDGITFTEKVWLIARTWMIRT